MYREYGQRLVAHKITNVKYYRTQGRYPRLHGKNAVRSYHGYGDQILLITIETDSGFQGWGPFGRYGNKPAPPEMLIGRYVSEVFDSESGITDESLGLFDIALHDLAGRILNIPISKMIEPSAVSSVSVYDGAIYMNDIIPETKPSGIDKILEECVYDYNLGHRAFKIKIGRGFKWMDSSQGLQRDIEVVSRIREAFPEVILMVDGNDGFTPETIISFLDGIGSCPLYWIEEPFREDSDNNRKLREYLDIHMPGTLIADGESRPDIPQLIGLARDKLLDIFQPDIVGYGFTPWRSLMKTLSQAGYRASPHAWGDVIKTHYCAHIAAAYTRHIPYVEGILGETEGIDHSGYTLANGILHIPDAPGFGMEFIWAKEL